MKNPSVLQKGTKILQAVIVNIYQRLFEGKYHVIFVAVYQGCQFADQAVFLPFGILQLLIGKLPVFTLQFYFNTGPVFITDTDCCHKNKNIKKQQSAHTICQLNSVALSTGKLNQLSGYL